MKPPKADTLVFDKKGHLLFINGVRITKQNSVRLNQKTRAWRKADNFIRSHPDLFPFKKPDGPYYPEPERPIGKPAYYLNLLTPNHNTYHIWNKEGLAVCGFPGTVLVHVSTKINKANFWDLLKKIEESSAVEMCPFCVDKYLNRLMYEI